MFEEFGFELTFLTWFIIAFVLLILEFMAPGIFFLWMGIAAAITGAIVLAGPAMGWEIQLVIFSVLSVISVYGGRKYISTHPVQSENSTLNRRGEQYIGKRCEVVKAITNGRGRVKVDDTVWSATGPDAREGQTIQVTGVKGTVLVVETIKKSKT